MNVDGFGLEVIARGIDGNKVSKVDRESIKCVEPHIVDNIWNYIAWWFRWCFDR